MSGSVLLLMACAVCIGWLIGAALVAHHEMHEQSERDMRARRDAFFIN